MSLDQHNSITTKATGLNFLLFDVTLTWEVPYGISQYVQCIFPHELTSALNSFMFHSSCYVLLQLYTVSSTEGLTTTCVAIFEFQEINLLQLLLFMAIIMMNSKATLDYPLTPLHSWDTVI